LDQVTADPKRADRDPKDDEQARKWAEETRRRAEAGGLPDESDYVAGKLAEEKRKLEHR
jgi:hypothetical protein